MPASGDLGHEEPVGPRDYMRVKILRCRMKVANPRSSFSSPPRLPAHDGRRRFFSAARFIPRLLMANSPHCHTTTSKGPRGGLRCNLESSPRRRSTCRSRRSSRTRAPLRQKLTLPPSGLTKSHAAYPGLRLQARLQAVKPQLLQQALHDIDVHPAHQVGELARQRVEGAIPQLDGAVEIVERLKAVVLENILGRTGQALPTLVRPGAFPDLVRHLPTECARHALHCVATWLVAAQGLGE